MQQLLTGKKRLAGFSGEWEVKRLGDVCTPSCSRINPLTSVENYRCVELEHISQESGRLLGYVDSKELKSQKSVFDKNDVLFSKLRPYLKKYLFAEFGGVCTTEIWVLKTAKGIESKWLYYLIQSDKIIETANQSTGTKMPRAEWKIVGNTEILVPPTKEEQTAIANILSDMDAEISQLEGRRAKMGELKQGMMQELLTGRIRLI
jgi:type I restriction enzyme S subunit